MGKHHLCSFLNPAFFLGKTEKAECFAEHFVGFRRRDMLVFKLLPSVFDPLGGFLISADGVSLYPFWQKV